MLSVSHLELIFIKYLKNINNKNLNAVVPCCLRERFQINAINYKQSPFYIMMTIYFNKLANIFFVCAFFL